MIWNSGSFLVSHLVSHPVSRFISKIVGAGRRIALPLTLAVASGLTAQAQTSPYDFAVSLPSTGSLQLHLYSNLPSITVKNTAIQQLVIAAGQRPTTDAYTAVAAAAAGAAVSNTTLILSVDYQENGTANADWVSWNANDGADWATGDLSTDAAQASSFQVIDDLVDMLATSGLYPNLQQITIAGFSAGGELVTRYSVSTAEPEILAPKNPNVYWNWVVASPSSYMYLDANRWDPSTQAFVDHTNALDNGTDPCQSLADYPYGFYGGFIPDYVTNGLLAAQNTDYTGRFLNRVVTYLVGDQDNSTSPTTDQGCEADLQGTDRIDRVEIFANYYKFLLANQDGQLPSTRSQFYCVVPGFGHQADLYNSTNGQFALFFPFGNTQQNSTQTTCTY